MKRADQHPVINSLQQNENFDPDAVISNESGIDTPSEKDPIEQAHTPSMGALPVDNMGSLKSGGEWKSTPGYEDHVAESIRKDDEEHEEGIIATGAGADPENNDDDI